MTRAPTRFSIPSRAAGDGRLANLARNCRLPSRLSVLARTIARECGSVSSPRGEERRHRLKSELDAIFAHLYHLDREDLEWILDAPYPSASFPGLKRKELAQFGEYRTQRYVLHAYDQLARGELPDLEGV